MFGKAMPQKTITLFVMFVIILSHTKINAENENNRNSGNYDSVITEIKEMISDVRENISLRASKLSNKLLKEMFEVLRLHDPTSPSMRMSREKLRYHGVDTVRALGGTVHLDPQGLSIVFDMSKHKLREKMRLAELHIHSSSKRSLYIIRKPIKPQRVKVNFIACDGTVMIMKIYRISTRLERKKNVIVMDITRIVAHAHSYENICGMEITFSGIKSVQSKRNESHQRSHVSHFDAVLVMFTKEGYLLDRVGKYDIRNIHKSTSVLKRKRLFKRSATAKSHEHRKRCERADLTVDFERIGWGDWVVYPKRFNAFMCTGRCPLTPGSDLDTTNHAIMQSLMRMSDRNLAPRPCCVPTKLSPLSMLYYDQNELVVKHHEDMIVDRCGCR